MTARQGEHKERWIRLLDQIFDPISAFEADYDHLKPKPEDGMVPGRRLRQIYRSQPPRSVTADAPQRDDDDDDETRKALGLYLYHKRKRWFALWDEAADRITACESEHVRSAPAQADRAASAATHVRRRLVHFLREVQIKHPDMPDMEIRPDGTGRYRSVMSAVDTLEALYFDLFEADNNYVDRAPTDSERRRRIGAGRRVREWIDFRASGVVDE